MTRHEIISSDSLRMLSAQVQRLQMQVQNMQRLAGAFRGELGDGGPGFLAYTAGGISARSGTTPGTGTVQPKKLTNGVIADYGNEIDVYSWAPTASSTATYVWISRDMHQTPWFTEEACT
jgi:hypothetical protein